MSVRKGIEAANRGYDVIPTVSVWGHNKYNALDTLEHYKKNAPAAQVKGYMTAPWKFTDMDSIPYFRQSFEELKEAKEKIYNCTNLM